MRRFVVLALGGLLVLGGCSSSSPCDAPPPRIEFRTGAGSPTLTVELAVTPSEREQGLMGRPSLAPGRGMAFLYDAPSTDGFWMKDTEIPLSIAFWGRNRRIHQIIDMDPCTADSCQVYRAAAPFRGAVEAPQGYFDSHGIHVGDEVDLHVVACP